MCLWYIAATGEDAHPLCSRAGKEDRVLYRCPRAAGIEVRRGRGVVLRALVVGLPVEGDVLCRRSWPSGAACGVYAKEGIHGTSKQALQMF